jgi:tetratricopeptide (TPR) repeat protein
MNRIGKGIGAITLAALIGLGSLNWCGSTPRKPMEVHTEKTIQAEANKPAQRRARKGPRQPPTFSPIPSETPADPIDNADPSQEDAPERTTHDEADLTERERKLREYLEHLEVIEDPNVAELTMLGEMAFDADEPAAAYEHYLEVIEDQPDDPMAPFALYKLAWAEYNLGDVEAAIDDMALMIEWIGDGETQMHEALLSQGAEDLDLFDTRAD